MKKIVLMLLFVLCAGNVFGQYYQTEFDKLDLTTPEKAVHAFIENYKTGNFIVVYHILDNQAQMNLMRYSTVNFKYNNYFRSATYEIYSEIYDDFDNDYGEQGIFNRPYLFHRLMSYARENKLLYINIGDCSITGRKKRENAEAIDSVDCYLKDSVNGTLTIRLTRSRKGRWRVHQVIVPSGNEGLFPWSVKEYN